MIGRDTEPSSDWSVITRYYRLDTGHTFPARFCCHGPAPALRSLWAGAGLHELYDHASGDLIIRPFQYSVWSSAALWLR